MKSVQFHWHTFSGHTAMQIMREIQTFFGPTEPCDFKGRIIFMSMFNNIERWTKDDQQKCLAKAREVTEYAKQFPVRSLVLPWSLTRTIVVSHALEQTKRSVGSHRQEKDTEDCRSFTYDIFAVLNFSSKEISSPKGQADHSCSECDSKTDHHSHCFDMQSVLHFRSRVCLD